MKRRAFATALLAAPWLARAQADPLAAHQFNVTALTGESLAMGEALLVDAQGKMLARSAFFD